MSRRPGNNVSEYPSSAHEIAKSQLSARAYDRKQEGLTSVELFDNTPRGWFKPGFDNGDFNAIFNAGVEERNRTVMPMVQGIIKPVTSLRGYGRHDPFVTELEKDLLVNPEKYYQGNYRVGRHFIMEPAEEGMESYYDSYRDDAPHLTENRPLPRQQRDILQEEADLIERNTPLWKTKKVVYYGSNGNRRR